MRLQVSVTFETVTDESAAHGDAADRGFVTEAALWTVRDTITRLRQCAELSEWPRVSGHTWACDASEQNYRTGEYYAEAVHVRRADGSMLSDHQARRLFRAAGLTKGGR